ncbi:MAG: hypothetical protein MI673_09865, partial [Thiotrichales bacterium]|nr:hypothetical protein [Thiotrichales bacterium]
MIIKQSIILIGAILILAFVLYSILSKSEEEVFAADVSESIADSDKCLKDLSQEDIDCEELLTRLIDHGRQAERYFRTDKSWKSRVIKIYSNAGSLSRELKNYTVSKTAYEKLIYYEPQQAPNYGLLSNALIKLNQIPPALVYSRLAVQLAP